MLRNKALAILQKTYDESYLSCSTAVYYESQGNEIESMRHWRSALEQIYDYRANKAPSPYVARTDTEKALQDALKHLELQCKERIDLLEALRLSRQQEGDSKSAENSPQLFESGESSSQGKGAIGQGTIPAITYAQLSRPALPHRPSSGAPPAGGSTPCVDGSTVASASPSPQHAQEKTVRSTSPEKYTMRTTLRSGKSGEKPAKLARKSPKPASEGPSKAATLAWSALGSKEKAAKGTSEPAITAATSSSPRTSLEQARKPASLPLQWDSHSRRLVTPREADVNGDTASPTRYSDEYLYTRSPYLSVSAASSALNSTSAYVDPSTYSQSPIRPGRSNDSRPNPPPTPPHRPPRYSSLTCAEAKDTAGKRSVADASITRRPIARRPEGLSPSKPDPERANRSRRRDRPAARKLSTSSTSEAEQTKTSRLKAKEDAIPIDTEESSTESPAVDSPDDRTTWKKKASILKSLPPGVDESAAKQILNDIVVQGEPVHWGDVAGLEIAKNALREAVVYPFLRPDLFMGLREPARGMLLFGPPGTGKTMLAKAVATESKSTFFSISASSLTSKYLGESEKLVRALFGLARMLAPSTIFVDEIDSLLSQRSGSGEHEATRRIKTEFLIQWSDLQRAAAGKETTEKDRERGDANRVLVLAATNLPWAIDEAARRRFVRRQYIPLPEPLTRETQFRTLLAQQKHDISDDDIMRLVELTDGFSGSDITALAKDAAMGPLRSLGEALLQMTMDEIRPIKLQDFEASLNTIRPSVSKASLKEFEDWAKEFGERGG